MFFLLDPVFITSISRTDGQATDLSFPYLEFCIHQYTSNTLILFRNILTDYVRTPVRSEVRGCLQDIAVVLFRVPGVPNLLTCLGVFYKTRQGLQFACSYLYLQLFGCSRT